MRTSVRARCAASSARSSRPATTGRSGSRSYGRLRSARTRAGTSTSPASTEPSINSYLASRAPRAALAALAVLAAAAAFVLLAAGSGDADPRQHARVQLEEIGRFDEPVYVHQPPSGADGQLFVVEQPGRIKVVNLNGGGESQFLNIEGKVASGGERGLLSIAFAPDYAESGRFYVFYTATGGDLTVEEYRRSAGDRLQADPSSARKLLDIEHSRFPNHNGGQLQFGPDGFLYVGTGDGGSFGDPSENAQDRKSLLGKILRIDPFNGKRYAIPK